MGLTLITPPTSEPLTVAEFKSHSRIDISTDDALVGIYIKAARQAAENWTRRAFVTQTWDYTLPDFPLDAIELPIQPVQSVTSVTYLDSTGTSTSLVTGSPQAANYDVTTDGSRALIFPKYGDTWPTTRPHGNTVTVRFVAGYSVTASPVTLPWDLKQAVYLLAAHFYENREPVVVGQVAISELPMAVEALLSPYQLRGF